MQPIRPAPKVAQPTRIKSFDLGGCVGFAIIGHLLCRRALDPLIQPAAPKEIMEPGFAMVWRAKEEQVPGLLYTIQYGVPTSKPKGLCCYDRGAHARTIHKHQKWQTLRLHVVCNVVARTALCEVRRFVYCTNGKLRSDMTCDFFLHARVERNKHHDPT